MGQVVRLQAWFETPNILPKYFCQSHCNLSLSLSLSLSICFPIYLFISLLLTLIFSCSLSPSFSSFLSLLLGVLHARGCWSIWLTATSLYLVLYVHPGHCRGVFKNCTNWTKCENDLSFKIVNLNHSLTLSLYCLCEVNIVQYSTVHEAECSTVQYSRDYVHRWNHVRWKTSMHKPKENNFSIS